MTEQKSAIDALKSLLSQPVEDKVALTNYTQHSVVKYVGGINIDWDPKDHPRDPNNGEFVETPGGFLFGKNLKAEFPLGKSKKSLSLKPGDVAFKTPSGNVVVSHADDSYTLHTPDGKEKDIPGGSSNVLVTNMAQQGKLEKIGENPAVQVPAKDLNDAKNKLANPGEHDPAKADLPKSPPAPPKEEAPNFPDHSSKGAQFLTSQDKIKTDTPDVKVAAKQAQEAKKKSTTTENVKDLNKTAGDLVDHTDAPGPQSGEDIFDKGHFGPNQHPGPAFKNGKTQYTAKQIADYQDEHKGAVLGQDGDGKDIKSGSWVELDGKPVQVHASPYGGVTAYRWVSTKQQASNLPKENLLSVNDFPDVKAIDDPTGKPYGKEVTHPNSLHAQNTSADSLKHGSIMSQAVTGAIPNTAVKHKLHVEKEQGKPLAVAGGPALKDQTGMPLKSGDWVDIEGKPWQVHNSPNDGNIAMAKWVSTKQKKSNNTYDFPASVLETAVHIADPTGAEYFPINKIDAAEHAKQQEEPDAAPPKPLADVPEAVTEPTPEPEFPTPDNYVYEPGDEDLADWEKELLGYPLETATPPSEEQAINDMASSYKASIQQGTDPGMIADIASGKLNLSEAFQKAAQKSISELHAEGMLGDAWMEQAGLDVPQKKDETPGQKKLSDSDVWFVFNKDKLVTSYYKTENGSWHADYEDGSGDTLSEADVQMDFDLPSSGANGSVADIQWSPTPITATEKVADPVQKPKVTLSDADEWDVVNAEGKPIGTYWKNANGNWNFTGEGGYSETDIPEETVQQDVADINNGVYDNVWTPVTTPTQPVQPTVEEKIVPDTSPNVFVHPVSGVTMQLEEGDEVYKAKLTENAYIVKKANSATPYHYFNYAGKAYKPKAEQKSFDKNYEKVDAWPGKKDGQSAAVPQKPAEPEKSKQGGVPFKPSLLDISQEGDSVSIGNTYAVKNADGKWYTQYGPDGSPDGGWLSDNDLKTAYGDEPNMTFHPQVMVMTEPNASMDPFADAGPTDLSQDLINVAVPGDEIHYTSLSGIPYVLKKTQDGWDWHDADGTKLAVTPTPKTFEAVLDGMPGNGAKFIPFSATQADKSHANVSSDNSQSEVDVQAQTVGLADQVKNAVAGDAFTLTNPNGETYTYYKKSDGDWQELNPNGQWKTVENDMAVTMAGPDNIKHYTKEWKGAGHKPEHVNYFDGAPWGGKEAVGEVSTPAPKKAAPAKKAAANADSYTIGAKTIDLKPGEFIAFYPNNAGGAYVHFTPKKNKYDYHDIYDSTGAQKNMYALQTKSAAQLKKLVKENDGASIVAEKKPLKAAKADYSAYESGADVQSWADKGYSEATAAYYAASGYVNALEKPIPLTYYGGLAGHSTIEGFDKPWNQMTSDERMQVIATYKDIAGNGYATMAELEKSIEDKSDKLKVTKTKNAFDLIHRIATMAEELANPDTEWTEDEFNSELSAILPKAQKPGVSMGPWLKGYFPIADIAGSLETASAAYSFKKTLTGIDFDPDTATLSEMDAYAKSKGFHFLSAMPPELHKPWVMNELGDPTIDGYVKNQLTAEAKKAKVKVGVAEVIGNLKKSGSPTQQVSKAPTVKGATAKAQLKNSYSWTATNGNLLKIQNTGNDEWQMDSANSSISVNDAVVQLVVNNALVEGVTNLHESDEYAYGSGDLAQQTEKFVKKFNPQGTTVGDLTESQLFDALNDPSLNGASVLSDSMSVVGKRRFLTMHLAGDEIGKYYMATSFLTTDDAYLKNHLGSPNTPSGKAAHAAFAAWVQSQPWGADYKNNGSYSTSPEFAQYVTDSYGESFVSQWYKYHPTTLLTHAPDTSVLTTPDGKPLAVKPQNVADDTWALVTNSTSEADFAPLFNGDPVEFMDETDLDAALSKNSKVVNSGLIPPLLGGVPLHLKKLTFWASQQTDDADLQSGILSSVAAKAKTGEFLTDSTPVWIAPDGGKFPISPGAKVYQYGDYYYVSGPTQPDGSVGNGYQFSAYSTPQQVSSYSFQNIINDSDYKVIFTMPDPLTWEKAKKENPDFDQTVWDFVEKAEADPKEISTALGSGAVLTAYLKNHPEIQNWANIYAQHKSLPEHVRNLVANALHQHKSGAFGQAAILDVIEYKASKGHYASMQSKGLYDPTAAWLPHLSLGQTSSEAVLSQWSAPAKSAYVKAFGLTDEGQIPAHLDSLINPPTVYVSKALPAWSDLQLTPTGKSLGGMHTKKHWVDQDGNEWMTKAFNSDPNAKARVDAEIAGIKIGSLYGFRVPDAEQLQLVPGQSDYAYLQHLKPGPGDFMSKGVGDLTTKQLQQAMEEHLLDWIISNHDSHSGNLRFDNNGNVFGIDKGQAFKHFPKDKLAVGYLPPENGAAVWYDQFYNALVSGKVDKAKADEVTKHVLRRAQQISKDKDEEFRAHLEYAFKNRTFWPDQYPSKQAFIDALVERKHNAFDDFVDFYKGLYKKSPHDWDIDTENLVPPKLDDHTHISVSQDYADDVTKAGLHGKAMMFASDDLEDSHILMSTALGANGKTMLTGEAKIRKDGDTILSNWLKQHTIESTVGFQPQSYHQPEPEEDEGDPAYMPQNSEWFHWLVSGSKTVSSHNKSGDQQYNTGTLENMENVKQQMDLTNAKVADWEVGHPGEPFVGTIPGYGHLGKTVVELQTMEQHEAFKKMLETYGEYYAKVIAAKGTTEKISPHFQQFTYSPSKKALDAWEKSKAEASADAVAITTDQGYTAVWEKQDDGMWKMKSTTAPNADIDSMKPQTESQINKWKADPKNAWKAVDKAVDAAEPETIEQDVKVGTKVLHVKYMPSSSPNGTIDFETGELKLKSGTTNNFQTGHMYQIDFGNTVIEYRPWDGQHNVAVAQKGLLRFYKKDWQGDSDSIDEIFDVLRQMGLSLDPADEESMETFYWNHMTQIMKNRKGGKTGKWKSVHDALSKSFSDNPNMSATETLQAYRDAWGLAIGDEKVKTADWMPKFSRIRPHSLKGDDEKTFTAGRPYWERADFDVEELQKHVKQFPVSSLHNADDALKIALSGAALSTEERARFYGSVAKTGMSSEADQNHGSSAVIYMRQNMGSGVSDYSVMYHPRVLMRTHNYSYAGDMYGEINNQENYAPWEVSEAAGFAGGSNETMVKNALSILDDIVMLKFNDETSRAKAIKHYKDLGIDKLHGFPIEEVFVTYLDYSKVKKMQDAIWAAMKEAAKK